MNRNKVYVQYVKYFWIPGYVVKNIFFYVLIYVFAPTLITGIVYHFDKYPGDLFLFIYWSLLISILFIPIYDVPIVTFLVFKQYRDKNLWNLLNALLIGVFVGLV